MLTSMKLGLVTTVAAVALARRLAVIRLTAIFIPEAGELTFRREPRCRGQTQPCIVTVRSP
jgi:hypothetical protein